MLDQIQTFAHPDVTPVNVLKRNNSLPSPLERLSNGDLSSSCSSKNNNKIINGTDPRMMPPPRKAIVRNNILLGRPAAVNAATSTIRSRSLWNTATLGRIPITPPTPPDSVASSESDTTRESSPRQQNSTPSSWYPLPIFVGVDHKSTVCEQNNEPTNVTTLYTPQKKLAPLSVPPPIKSPTISISLLQSLSSEIIELIKRFVYWEEPFQSFSCLVICLTIPTMIMGEKNPIASTLIYNGLTMIGLCLLTIAVCQNIVGNQMLTTELFRWPMFQYWTNKKMYPFLVTYDPHLSLTCAAVIETCNQMMNMSQFICLILFLGPKLIMDLQL